MDIITPGAYPQINAATCALVNNAMQSAAADYVEADYEHADFLEYARDNGMDQRLLAFLTERGDLAGATPNAWMRLTNVGQQEWHGGLSSDTRQQITMAVIGREGYNNYVDWVISKAPIPGS